MRLRNVFLTLVFGWAFLYEENNFCTIDKVFLKSVELSAPVKIVHMSDLHAKRLDNVFGKLGTFISSLNPDLIALTGDIVTGDSTKDLAYVSYLKKSFGKVPVYYVSGNHELANYKYLKEFKKAMSDVGFTFLDEKSVSVRVGSNELTVAGIGDPNGSEGDPTAKVESDLAKVSLKSAGFSILLAHRALFTPLYNQSTFDLILTGHAHGGLIGVPFTAGNLYSNDEGFFPKYTKGMIGKTHISRGIGNSRRTFRIFNHPQITMLTVSPVK